MLDRAHQPVGLGEGGVGLPGGVVGGRDRAELLEPHAQPGQRRAELVGGVVAELALAAQHVLDAAVGVGERGADRVELGDAGRVGLDADARLGHAADPRGEALHRRREPPRLHEREPDGGRDRHERQHDHGQPDAADVVGALGRGGERGHADGARPGRLGAQRMRADASAALDRRGRRAGRPRAARRPGRARRACAGRTGRPARNARPTATAAASASRSSRASARWRSSRDPTIPSGTPRTRTATSAIDPVEIEQPPPHALTPSRSGSRPRAPSSAPAGRRACAAASRRACRASSSSPTSSRPRPSS